MNTITLQQLIDAKACPQQVELFREHFGKSVRVTIPKGRKYAKVFDWDFAAHHFLDTSARKSYDEAIAPASKAYDEATVTASKAYHEAIAPALKVRSEATVTASKVRSEAIAPALKAYDEAIAPALKAYDEARAVAFATAYLSQEETK
jgi:hypothetical protein